MQAGKPNSYGLGGCQSHRQLDYGPPRRVLRHLYWVVWRWSANGLGGEPWKLESQRGKATCATSTVGR